MMQGTESRFGQMQGAELESRQLSASAEGRDLRTPEAEDAARAEHLLANLARDVNTTIGKKMVSPDGRIKMSMYGDVMPEEKIAADAATAKARKIAWAGLNDENVQQHYIERFGLAAQTDGKTSAEIAELLMARIAPSQAERAGSLAENAATILLHRALSEKFIVVKAAEHDDHEHGLDTIMVNKETGEVVCAFDEVSGTNETDTRYQEKRARQKKAMARGGSKLDYGFTIADGRVVKKSFANVPVFRLQLSPEDARQSLFESETYVSGLGGRSEKIMGAFLATMEQQTEEYLAMPDLSAPMREQLEAYRDGSLRTIRELVAGE